MYAHSAYKIKGDFFERNLGSAPIFSIDSFRSWAFSHNSALVLQPFMANRLDRYVLWSGCILAGSEIRGRAVTSVIYLTKKGSKKEPSRKNSELYEGRLEAKIFVGEPKSVSSCSHKYYLIRNGKRK